MGLFHWAYFFYLSIVKSTERLCSAGELSDMLWFAGAAPAVKLLLAPSFRSTDLEVHRNWLTVTSSLPLSQWLVPRGAESTGPSTTLPSSPTSSASSPSPHASSTPPSPTSPHSAVLFQRLSVVSSDVVLFYAIHRLGRRPGVVERWLLCLLFVWSPALVMANHVHFQYNGFLIGVLMVSVWFLVEGRDLAGGFVFAVVLCLKHLFAVAAPVYFVYLLRHNSKGGGFWREVGRFLTMGAAVGSVLLWRLGPSCIMFR